MHQLAHWGARVMGRPRVEDLEPGWLVGALRMAFPVTAAGARIEFRIGAEVASLADGEARAGGTDEPDAVVTGDAADFYRLVVDRDLDAVSVEGSVDALGILLAMLPPAAPPAAVTATDQLSAA